MVIQSNMSPKAIAEVWENTVSVFEKYNVTLTDRTLETFIEAETLASLLVELNKVVGSSGTTCIEGG